MAKCGQCIHISTCKGWQIWYKVPLFHVATIDGHEIMAMPRDNMTGEEMAGLCFERASQGRHGRLDVPQSPE